MSFTYVRRTPGDSTIDTPLQVKFLKNKGSVSITTQFLPSKGITTFTGPHPKKTFFPVSNGSTEPKIPRV